MNKCIDHGKKGNKDGYVIIKFKESDGLKAKYLHRILYAEKLGCNLQDLDGIQVGHSCYNKRCINPDHLVDKSTIPPVNSSIVTGKAKLGSPKFTDVPGLKAKEVRDFAKANAEMPLEEIAEHFLTDLEKVDKIVNYSSFFRDFIKSDCIEHKQKKYGTTRMRIDGVVYRAAAHRAEFFKAHGYWPEVCRHLCNNERCINPDHLADGQDLDNSRDRVDAGNSRKPVVKLTQNDIKKIKSLYRYKDPVYNTLTLSKMFGVSPKRIANIVRLD